jgi:pimeloyl-ACP methyl ester carboxylesterase
MPAFAERIRVPVSWLLAVCCAAAALAGCASSSSGGGPDVLTTPIQLAHTTDGTVAYRELGSGPALLLIMGAGGTMDAWPPSMVDALAARHQVVMFDNAGVGQTSAVSAPGMLSIPAETSQTSALIAALGLRRPAVLGWSMGSMIAQDLAITHPAQVSRLILAASGVGTGAAVPLPPWSTVSGLSPEQVVASSFPKDQAAAVSAYLNAIQQYPGSYQVSAATFHGQYLAGDGWLTGQVAAGHLAGDIRVPTLVAGGTADIYIAMADERQLAGSVPGAKLLLFPDAGHAFLFQDAAAFTQDVETFLG